jgi:hypothetical protein
MEGFNSGVKGLILVYVVCNMVQVCVHVTGYPGSHLCVDLLNSSKFDA